MVEFTPLVHLYFYVAVAMVVVMWGIGTRQWQRVRRSVVRQFENKTLAVAAALMGFVFAAMYVTESHDAIVQWFETGATMNRADGALTVGAGLVITWLVACGLMCLVLYAVGRISGDAKNGRLHVQLEEFLQEQEAKEARRRYAKRMRMAQRVEPRPSKAAYAKLPSKQKDPQMAMIRPLGKK